MNYTKAVMFLRTLLITIIFMLVFIDKQTIKDMPAGPDRQEESVRKTHSRNSREREINILLLGQTGVGKSTFINAFANYIVYDTIQEVENIKMQVIIPASFTFANPVTFDEKTITLGEEDEHEKFCDQGQSSTQQCRSFVFPIGDRNLRFIDTPGIGDTRGIEQDTTNFQEILNYIAQYEHLNAVCILLKPNEERLNVLFRFCINELLRHLHVSARENLIFIFTNSRSTFFMPGSSIRILRELITQYKKACNVDVPLSRDNAFLFDNEGFRYLALRKHDISLDEDQTESYIKSWDHSVKEYSRLMQYIVTRPLHAVCNTLSLNEAEQLIRKLSRPIAETTKLIEENIQLVEEHKKRMLENPHIALQGIPQNKVTITLLKHPRTVCASEKCCAITEVDAEKKIEYLRICHDECYLKGIVQDTMNDPKLRECEVMDKEKGNKYILATSRPYCAAAFFSLNYDFKPIAIHLVIGTHIVGIIYIEVVQHQCHILHNFIGYNFSPL